ncbi:unnamed protein product [Brugia pahangi]|uniref:Pentatricopeptide repeat-containing protein n=1 Tax=Brugia pahangi TaxID=6280 RepID=A0A158PSA3_BRUPA|nr:unnamed protein product [Brugia pahangi]
MRKQAIICTKILLLQVTKRQRHGSYHITIVISVSSRSRSGSSSSSSSNSSSNNSSSNSSSSSKSVVVVGLLHSPATMDSITPRSVAYIHGRPTGIIMILFLYLFCKRTIRFNVSESFPYYLANPNLCLLEYLRALQLRRALFVLLIQSYCKQIDMRSPGGYNRNFLFRILVKRPTIESISVADTINELNLNTFTLRWMFHISLTLLNFQLFQKSLSCANNELPFLVAVSIYMCTCMY